jgi:hypothetical protein
MKKILTLLLALTSVLSVSAQTPTWSDQIASLVFEKCGYCHHPAGLAPFSLLTYNDAFLRRNSIQSYVVSKQMPPWPPNDDYQNYAHKRSMSQAQIDLIDDWVNGGAPEGNAANTPAPPSYNQGAFLANPDMVLRAPLYASRATAGHDDYVCFSVPTGLTTNKKLKAIEVVPGNPSIVHHCLVYYDAAASSVTDTSGNCAGPTTGLIAGFAPGEFPTIYPNGESVKMGIELAAGSKLVLAMHYPQGSTGVLDSTKIHLFFYDDTITNIRTVMADPVLQDFGFCIGQNTVDTIYDVFPPSFPMPYDATLLSVFPHAHLLGKEFLVYAVKANGDTIPIIHIPQWNFEWQGFYLFKNPIKLPLGSRLYGGASYDNTTNNPFNPNQPPQNICAGLNTTDEMFLVYFQYLAYQQGDELLDMDSLTMPPNQGTPTSIGTEAVGENYLLAYPNPFNRQLVLDYYLENDTEVNLKIFDIQGRMVRTVVSGQIQNGRQTTVWDGKTDSAAELPNGLYILYLQAGDRITTQKVMLSK